MSGMFPVHLASYDSPCPGRPADGLRRATHRVGERISHVWSQSLSRARPEQ